MNASRAVRRSLRVPLVVLIVLALGALGWLVFGGESEGGGRAAFLAGDFERSAAIHARSARSDPEARYYFGVAQRHRRIHTDAIEAFTVLQTVPELRARAWYQLVRTLIDAERLGEARAEVEAMPAGLETIPLAHEAAGLVHLAAGQDEATRVLDRLETIVGVSRGWLESRIQRVVHAPARDYPTEMQRMHALIGDRAESGELGGIEAGLERSHEQYVAAIQSFEHAVELFDDRRTEIAPARALFELAAIEEFRRRDGAAEGRRRKLIALTDDHVGGDLDLQLELGKLQAKTVEYLAETLIAADRPRDALAVLERVPRNDSGEREYVYERLEAEAWAALGDDVKASAIATRWLARDDDLAAMNFLMGSMHHRQGDLERAVFRLEKASARSGRRDVRELLARVYMQVGSYDRANAIVSDLVQSSPTSWELQLLRIRALEGMGWFDEARAELATLLRGPFADRGAPGNAAMRAYMDELLERHRLIPNDLYKARSLYTADPNNMLAGTRYLGFLIEERNWTDAQRLAASLERTMPAGDPEAFTLALHRGRLALHRDEVDAAASAFEQAVALRPWEPSAYAGLARASLEEGRLGTASRQIEQLAALDETAPELPHLRFELYRTSRDFPRLLEHGRRLLAEGADSFELRVATAEAALELGRMDEAREVLATLAKQPAPDAEAMLRVHDLFVRAGDDERADAQIVALVASHGQDAAILTRAAAALAARDRHDLLADLFDPIVAADPLTSAPIAFLLAETARDRGRHVRFLEILAQVRGVDRARTYAMVAEFCAEEGALDEVESIVAAARRDDASSPQILSCAARVALLRDDRQEAANIVNRLARDPGARSDEVIALRARLLDAAGDVVEAQDLLEEALRNPELGRDGRERLRLTMIDLLGSRNRPQAMIDVVRRAIAAGDDAEAISVRVCEHVVAQGVPDAASIVDTAVTSYGEKGELLWLRGLLRAERGDWPGAFGDFRQARDDLADLRSGHALAIAAGMTGRRGDLLRAHELRSGERLSGDVAGSRAQAELVLALMGPRPLDAVPLARALDLGNALVARDLAAFIERNAAEPAALAALRSRLPLYFLGAGDPRSQEIALAGLARLEEELPNEARVVDLLRARALMSFPATWERGVAIVGQILARSQMQDDTALVIYLQSYVAGGQSSATVRLVDHAIESDVFDAEAARAAARVLIDAGRAEDAARLMHLSPERSDEKSRLEALALFRSGNVARAGAVLEAAGPAARSTPEALQILAEAKALDPKTLPEAFDLATRAVYGAVPADDGAHLTLAKIAFASRREGEAWKNVRRYVDARPASSARLAEALRLVDALAPDDVAEREALRDRLMLLDPAQSVLETSARR